MHSPTKVFPRSFPGQSVSSSSHFKLSKSQIKISTISVTSRYLSLFVLLLLAIVLVPIELNAAHEYNRVNYHTLM